LARTARFVIADLTDARAVQAELQEIVPTLPSVPVQPIILDGQAEYGMFEHIRRYAWVLQPYCYQDTGHLLESLDDRVVSPALTKAEEIAERNRAIEAEPEKQR